MGDTTASLRRKIGSAGALQSVVRTMKAMAAASIGQYEQSVRALADYSRTVELGLGASFRKAAHRRRRDGGWGVGRRTDGSMPVPIVAVVFGSDQGLVGRFNDVVAADALEALSALPGRRVVWAVGERVYARLADTGLKLAGLFAVPNSVKAITPLVGQILVEREARQRPGAAFELHLFYNRPSSEAVYAPSVSDSYRWMTPGAAAWPTVPGRRNGGARSWLGGPRSRGSSFASTCSFRSSGRALNPCRARTQAAWRRCGVPKGTSAT